MAGGANVPYFASPKSLTTLSRTIALGESVSTAPARSPLACANGPSPFPVLFSNPNLPILLSCPSQFLFQPGLISQLSGTAIFSLLFLLEICRLRH